MLYSNQIWEIFFLLLLNKNSVNSVACWIYAIWNAWVKAIGWKQEWQCKVLQSKIKTKKKRIPNKDCKRSSGNVNITAEHFKNSKSALNQFTWNIKRYREVCWTVFVLLCVSECFVFFFHSFIGLLCFYLSVHLSRSLLFKYGRLPMRFECDDFCALAIAATLDILLNDWLTVHAWNGMGCSECEVR